MQLSWFNMRAVNALVDELVAQVQRASPPETLAGAGPGRKAEAKLRKVHDRVLQRATDFARESRPNVLQKAHLANRFKWALREAKYPDWFIDEFSYELAAVIAAALSQRKV